MITSKDNFSRGLPLTRQLHLPQGPFVSKYSGLLVKTVSLMFQVRSNATQNCEQTPHTFGWRDGLGCTCTQDVQYYDSISPCYLPALHVLPFLCQDLVS